MFSLLFLMVGCAEEMSDSAFRAEAELPEGDRVAIALVGQDLSADFDAESGVGIVQAPAEPTSNTNAAPATQRVHFLNYYDIPVENANTGFLHYVSRESNAVYYLAAADPTGASTQNYGASGSNITLSHDGSWTYYNLRSTLNGAVNGYDIWGSYGKCLSGLILFGNRGYNGSNRCAHRKTFCDAGVRAGRTCRRVPPSRGRRREEEGRGIWPC